MTITKESILLFLPIFLTACTLVDVEYEEAVKPTSETESLEEILEEQPVRETKNVTYTGTVQPAGISIYQQGSHRLSLPGGKFILLEAENLDLNGYVSEEVTIFGSLRPTVEAGGLIMRVERIELIAPRENVKADEEAHNEPVEEELPVNISDTTDEENAKPDLEPEDEESTEIEDTESVEDDVEEIATEEVVESEEESPPAVEESTEFKERVEVMSRQDYESSHWTQQYCSSHIGFCSPVHRNWWFKSFGTTNDKLWHVEFSSAPIDALGQGPISVDLIAGDIPVATGTIDDSNGSVTGYSEWTFGRHFVISADSSLKIAVEYITHNITEYVQ